MKWRDQSVEILVTLSFNCISTTLRLKYIDWALLQTFYGILHLMLYFSKCTHFRPVLKSNTDVYIGPARTCHIIWSQASTGSWSGKRELICIFKQPQNSVIIGQWFQTKIDMRCYFDKRNKSVCLSTRKTGKVKSYFQFMQLACDSDYSMASHKDLMTSFYVSLNFLDVMLGGAPKRTCANVCSILVRWRKNNWLLYTL